MPASRATTTGPVMSWLRYRAAHAGGHGTCRWISQCRNASALKEHCNIRAAEWTSSSRDLPRLRQRIHLRREGSLGRQAPRRHAALLPMTPNDGWQWPSRDRRHPGELAWPARHHWHQLPCQAGSGDPGIAFRTQSAREGIPPGRRQGHRGTQCPAPDRPAARGAFRINDPGRAAFKRAARTQVGKGQPASGPSRATMPADPTNAPIRSPKRVQFNAIPV